MKNILVPTDFSKNAENALYYAIELAKKEMAKLILLHVYETSYTNSYVPANLIAEEAAEAKHDSNQKLKALSTKIMHAGKIEHEAISEEGDTVDTILRMTKEKNIDLVVMGTKGATGLSGAIFGSIAEKVIEKAKCPVIAVPEGASFQAIKKITFATSYHHSDIRGLKRIIEIAEPFHAQIDVLHVADESESPEEAKTAMKTFMNEVNSKITYTNITFEILPGKTVEKALEKYINNDSTSMLVMSAHHRDFWDKIFGKSVTKQMAYHTKVPLMALHYKSAYARVI